MPRPPSNLTFNIKTLGDQALVIDYGDRLDPEVNARACAVAAMLRSLRWPGVVDVVPSFAAVTLHLRLEEIEWTVPGSPLAALRARLRDWLAGVAPDSFGPASDGGVEIEIPVCYGGAHGPDLADAAPACGLSIEQLIDLHQAPARVYMLGFAPGAPYIGLYDERLSLPRRSTPRLKVPAGSVGIANRQCVVYPVDAPGGWSLIGRTPLRLFDARRSSPSLLQPGSAVRFRAITAEEWQAWPAP